MMNTHVVTDNVDEGNARRGLPVDTFKKADKFLLSFSGKALPDHFSRSGVEGGKEIEGSIPLVLVLKEVWLVSFLGWLCWRCPWSWLKGCFLINREHDLMGKKGTGVEINNVGNALVESPVPRVFGGEPHVGSPGL